ncbi:MAG: hypothetical protein E7249_15660 [Paenibacillaceae bacterium]|nr:hypothetical protein [Paenibacillaceae bacterium]
MENHKSEEWISNISGFGVFEEDNRVIVSFASRTDDGMTVNHTVLADYRSANGDSGGLVYMVVNGDSIPAGVHRAGNGSSSAFCKVQRIIDSLDVTPY